MNITYKGFELNSAAEHLRDSDEWSVRVLITKHHENEVKEKFCSANNAFCDKVEAERHSIEFGKQIVDGQYQNATIDDLL